MASARTAAGTSRPGRCARQPSWPSTPRPRNGCCANAAPERHVSVTTGIVQPVHTSGRSRRPAGAGGLKPPGAVDRLEDGTWMFAPSGDVTVVAGGEALVCHAGGDALEAITRHHVARHDLDLPGYREWYGLNRKTSLSSHRRSPSYCARRACVGGRRTPRSAKVSRLGRRLAKSGELHDIGSAAQSAGTRRTQRRRPASRDEASAALRAHRAGQTTAARERWGERARAFGFVDLDAYLADRCAAGTAPTGSGPRSAWAAAAPNGCSRARPG